ncbi:MAG: class I SAM-dependent methyltransferase [Bacillota bacterium]|jgi:tRNA G37 N-methylase Trm5|nr:class I SAM-dependent methyltransferase [Bacillota bacterium]HHU30433.1 methyltransferase domain-containing protein [Bacillota bacterium]
MKKPLIFAHELVAATLKPGDMAVDATCGRGNDTLFLARLVGEKGKVFAIDIQPEAIVATQEKLQSAGLLDHVTLVQGSHAEPVAWPQGKVKAVMINLGYLPGGDHSLVTKPETTVAALQIACGHLQTDGIITIVVYTGHAGGIEEYRAVHSFCTSLPQEEYTVLEYRMINQVNNPPLLIAVMRR